MQLPLDSPYSDRFNADRLASWFDSDLTLFPSQEPTSKSTSLPVDANVEPATIIQSYLLRDYQLFPQQFVRYWVKTTSTTEPYMWVNETSELLDEFLVLEENNGCIPEQGIIASNLEKVEQHKHQVYLQYPAPILVNTWTSSKLPFQTRRRPAYKPPHILQQAVVQQLFHASNGTQAYFQGIVIGRSSEKYCVRWTDGIEQNYRAAEIRVMLYDPISYVYDFLHV